MNCAISPLIFARRILWLQWQSGVDLTTPDCCGRLPHASNMLGVESKFAISQDKLLKNLPAIALLCAAVSACSGLPARAPADSAASAGPLAQNAPEQQAAPPAPPRPRLRSASTTAAPGERLP